MVQWESEDSYKLTGPKLRETGAYIHGNVEALLRADPGTRADFYVKLIEHSVMCPDDARAKEEYMWASNSSTMRLRLWSVV